MIVTIVNRFWIEVETTKELAELMIARGEITSYKTPKGDTVEWEADIIEPPIIRPKNITRKTKV